MKKSSRRVAFGMPEDNPIDINIIEAQTLRESRDYK